MLLVAVLSSAGAGAAGSVQSSPAAVCELPGSAARVAAGQDGSDPNSLSSGDVAALERAFEQRAEPLRESGAQARGGLGGQVIPVRTYIHVITKRDGTGNVSRARIRQQMAVINAAYAGRSSRVAAPSPFRFVLTGVDVTRNDAWYDWRLDDNGHETVEAVNAKRTLHRGSRQDLNIYIAGLSDGLLGYATFPDTTPLKLDGVVILNDSLPKGSAEPFNEGDTAVHEIGHWLYLFHTFQNGCTPPGDQVADTPYQADGPNIFYCGDWPADGTTTTPDDTCPRPGRDPVHNFMSYGDDPCMDQFTKGQVHRQIRAWFAFRFRR